MAKIGVYRSSGGGGTSSGITGVTAGNGLTGGGSSGSVSLAVNTGNGLEISSDAVIIDLDGSTLSTSSDGIKLSDSLPRDRGAWTASTQYYVGDIVVNSNTIYRCKTANTDASFTASNWDNLSSGGLTQSEVDDRITNQVTKSLIDGLNVDADTLDGNDSAYYLNYNNLSNTPTIPAAFTNEMVDDRVNALLTAGTNISLVYDDAANTLTINSTASGTTGLTQAQVDARITTQVTKTFVDGLNVDADTLDGNDSTHYLDYNNLTNTPTLASSIVIPIPNSDITYTNEYTMQIANLADLDQGSIIVFQYNPGSDPSDSNQAVSWALTGHSDYSTFSRGRAKINDANGQRDLTLNDLERYSIYMLYRAGSFWHYVGGTRNASAWRSNLDTGNISEGTNLYFTPARANTAIDTRVNKAFIDALNISYTSLSDQPTIPTQYTDEMVDDRVNALLTAGSNITLTYDDTGNTLTINSTGDITGVTAGNGLSGGGASGDLTLNVMIDGDTLTASASGVKVADTLPRDRGAWVASTQYYVGDIVTNNDNVYRCKTANTDATFTSSNWDIFTSVNDVSGMDLERPTQLSEGMIWVDSIKHNAFIGVKKYHSATLAQGTGTEFTATTYGGVTSSRVPETTTSGTVFLHLPTDTFREIFYDTTSTSPQTRILTVSQVHTSLTLYEDPYTSAIYIGQQDNAIFAAENLPSGVDTTTVKVFFYNRDEERLEYLSAYTAGVGRVEYWDYLHLLTYDDSLNLTQASEQQGTVADGAGHVTWYGYVRAATMPTTFPTMNVNGVLDFAGSGWYTSIASANAGGVLSETLWLGLGSAYRNVNGAWTNRQHSIQALWGAQFSTNSDGPWNPVQADFHSWWRWRNTDGSYSNAHRIIGNNDFSEKIMLFNYNVWYASGTSTPLERTFDTINDIDIFDELLWEMRQWDGWTNYLAGNVGPTVSGRILRPENGWPVNDVNRQFVWVFSARHGIHINIENDVAGYTHPVSLPSSGSNLSNSAVRSGRAHFADSAGVPGTGGEVNKLVNTNWGSSYARVDLRIWGIRHGIGR